MSKLFKWWIFISMFLALFICVTGIFKIDYIDGLQLRSFFKSLSKLYDHTSWAVIPMPNYIEYKPDGGFINTVLNSVITIANGVIAMFNGSIWILNLIISFARWIIALFNFAFVWLKGLLTSIPPLIVNSSSEWVFDLSTSIDSDYIIGSITSF